MQSCTLQFEPVQQENYKKMFFSTIRRDTFIPSMLWWRGLRIPGIPTEFVPLPYLLFNFQRYLLFDSLSACNLRGNARAHFGTKWMECDAHRVQWDDILFITYFAFIGNKEFSSNAKRQSVCCAVRENFTTQFLPQYLSSTAVSMCALHESQRGCPPFGEDALTCGVNTSC